MTSMRCCVRSIVTSTVVQLANRKLLRILRRPVLRNPKLCDLRVQPADPLHPFALVINQGILAKAFEAQTCPIQSAWFRTPFLPQQHENSSQPPCYGTRCEQSKISHAVPPSIRHVQLQDIQKPFSEKAQCLEPVVSCVLCQIFDRFTINKIEAMPGDRWPPNVSACILQKMSLRHFTSNEDVPLAFVLNLEHVHQVFAKKRGLEHFFLQRFSQEGDYRISPGSH